MPPSNPPPDRFQREIDDIIRLAERRLEHQSFGYRVRKSTRRLSGAMGGFSLRLPSAEAMGGIGLALLMLAWLLSLIGAMPLLAPLARTLQPWVLGIGLLLLVLAILKSVLRGRGGGGNGGGSRMWRGERVAYGSPYGEGLFRRLRRMLRGR
jgi:hypothetical protein